MADPKRWQIGLVGYGEVGKILAEDLRQQHIEVAAFDIKLGSGQGASLREHAAKFGVELTAFYAELTTKSDFIVSAVTAAGRAEEVREVAETVPEAGLTPWSAPGHG